MTPAERPTMRQLREQELRNLLAANPRISGVDAMDFTSLSDAEIDGLISISGRKTAHVEERADNRTRRRRRR